MFSLSHLQRTQDSFRGLTSQVRCLQLLACLVVVVTTQTARAQVQATKPAQVFRQNDHRVPRQDAKAKQLGINKYESRHLILYTDISPEIAKTLPDIVDQAYVAWTNYFGELPPARDGKPFQITGYLMQDESRFIECGMQPEGFVMAKFGRQIGQEFWMHEQSTDYYRRHLLIHEATHAFMTTMPSVLPPLWYHEGMAEYFATHLLHENGRVDFCVFPESSESFQGLGRLDLIEEEQANGTLPDLREVMSYQSTDYLNLRPTPYTWSWALCSFLDQHPDYQARFRKLSRNLERSNFVKLIETEWEKDQGQLEFEWNEFTSRVAYGYDFARNKIQFADQLQELNTNSQREVLALSVPANRGWVSSGYRIAAGSQLSLKSDGRVTLRTSPSLLEAEPTGITYDYANQFPIGTLLVGLRQTATNQSGHNQSGHNQSGHNQTRETASTFLVLPVGKQLLIPVLEDSELFFRVNDFASSLADNSGEFKLELHPTSAND